MGMASISHVRSSISFLAAAFKQVTIFLNGYPSVTQLEYNCNSISRANELYFEFSLNLVLLGDILLYFYYTSFIGINHP